MELDVADASEAKQTGIILEPFGVLGVLGLFGVLGLCDLFSSHLGEDYKRAFKF